MKQQYKKVLIRGLFQGHEIFVTTNEQHLEIEIIFFWGKIVINYGKLLSSETMESQTAAKLADLNSTVLRTNPLICKFL